MAFGNFCPGKNGIHRSIARHGFLPHFADPSLRIGQRYQLQELDRDADGCPLGVPSQACPNYVAVGRFDCHRIERASAAQASVGSRILRCDHHGGVRAVSLRGCAQLQRGLCEAHCV